MAELVRRRVRWLDRLLTVTTGLCAGLAALLFFSIAGVLLWRGLAALDLAFLVKETAEAGAAGGVRYQILGTLLLVATALLAAAPPAVALALAKAVYLPRRWAGGLGVALTAVNGIPSILFGIFGLILFSRWLDWGKSWLAGGVLLGVMILPAAAVALAERMEALPESYLEAAAGLGLSRSQIVRSVILPQSAPGLASGLLLGLARAAGETAPILFTAAVFSGVTLPAGIRESPVLALPYHIFTLAQDSLQPEVQTRVWAAAFVLVALVTLMALVALPARLRLASGARDA